MLWGGSQPDPQSQSISIGSETQKSIFLQTFKTFHWHSSAVSNQSFTSKVRTVGGKIGSCTDHITLSASWWIYRRGKYAWIITCADQTETYVMALEGETLHNICYEMTFINYHSALHCFNCIWKGCKWNNTATWSWTWAEPPTLNPSVSNWIAANDFTDSVVEIIRAMS